MEIVKKFNLIFHVFLVSNFFFLGSLRSLNHFFSPLFL
jgi:hypothetical protein